MVKAFVNTIGKRNQSSHLRFGKHANGVDFVAVIHGARGDLNWYLEIEYQDADIIILFSESHNLKTNVHPTNEGYLKSLKEYVNNSIQQCKTPKPIIVVQEVNSDDGQLLMDHIKSVSIAPGIDVPIFAHNFKDPSSTKNLAEICKQELNRENPKYIDFCTLTRNTYDLAHSYTTLFKTVFTWKVRMWLCVIAWILFTIVQQFVVIPAFPFLCFYGAGCVAFLALVLVDNLTMNSK